MKFSFQVSNAKQMFDPKKFESPRRRARRKILYGFGAYCKTVARNSIKTKPKGTHSKPGEIPFGHDGPTRYKDFIFFVVDEARGEVVIGAEKLPRKNPSPTPGVLEYGGDVLAKVGNSFQVVRQEARPHMRPAFEKSVQKQLDKLIEHSLVGQ